MSKTDIFIATAIDIANDDTHGYSQLRRWFPDFDCSSLIYYCAEKAGYKVKKSDPRYTGTMISDFENVGFNVLSFDGNLNDLDPGDILLNTAHHTALYIGNGRLVEASIDENGSIEGATPGDQTGHEIHIRGVYDYPWTHVLTPPIDDVVPAKLDNAITEMAKAVLDGKFGNGAERKERLYTAVQSKVNELVK